MDFAKKLQIWDGFGFNYVETAQTMDYAKDPQEYGGVGLLKMFLDPFHQVKPGGKFDHETTTQWLRYVAREGLKK